MKLQIHELKNLTTKTMSKKINFKSSITAMAMLLLLITGLATSCKKTTCNYAPCTVRDSINISTGLGKNGTVDPNWKVISSPYLNGQPIIAPSNSTWQTAPVITTNASWINCTGVSYPGNLIGAYTYERTFTIAPNTINFSCNFGVAYDDSLVSLELIAPIPSLAVTTLTEPAHAPAYLGTIIGTVFTNPLPGVWTIRAKVKSIDAGTGFLTSGFINTLKPCQ